jgi:uncharacterized protein
MAAKPRWPFTAALVTGASSGIGESIVRALASEGVPVVVVARRRDRLEALAGELAGVEVFVADLTVTDDLERVVERVRSASAPVDLVVNNAGFGTSGDFVDLDPGRLRREVRLNVGALTALSHAALSAMVPRGRGFLLNVSSVAGFQPAPRLAVYSATKAYVTSLSESLHEEVRGAGVHVCALCPGLTRTEFQQVSNPDRHERSSFPGMAWLKADDVARAGLDDVARNRAVSVPGAFYKFLTTGSDLAPRGIVRRISGRVQR